MTRRVKILLFLLPLAVLLTIPLAFFAFWFAVSAGSDEGSPALATEWHARLASYGNPKEASSRDPHIEVLHFTNGQWLFGLAQDSHGIWRRGGGTLVVKDSRGETRAFLGGHVCGPGYLEDAFSDMKSLDAVYDRLAEYGFREY